MPCSNKCNRLARSNPYPKGLQHDSYVHKALDIDIQGLLFQAKEPILQPLLNPINGCNFKRKMENRGLLFIPDISGFTRFVNESEIEHSRLIIQELLELLINANQLGLEISEIEGDAILFYKFGDPPHLQDLYQQVANMFCAFHRHLIAYEHRRFCQCAACMSAINLTLKVITHYGEFTHYNVKNFSKLIGRDVIVAHQLLKNDIEQHEYWLVTKNVEPSEPPATLAEWMQWYTTSKHTESGEIPFHYTQLTQLKKALPPDPPLHLELEHKAKMFTLSREYATDIITLFHASGDVNHRAKWQVGVKAVEEIEFHLPRVGMRCRCILDNGEQVIYASSYRYSPEHIEFSETDEKKHCSTYYTLEKIAPNRTGLTLEYYIEKSFAAQVLFSLFKKKKLEEAFRQSLENLDGVVKELQIPTEDWQGAVS